MPIDSLHHLSRGVSNHIPTLVCSCNRFVARSAFEHEQQEQEGREHLRTSHVSPATLPEAFSHMTEVERGKFDAAIAALEQRVVWIKEQRGGALNSAYNLRATAVLAEESSHLISSLLTVAIDRYTTENRTTED